MRPHGHFQGVPSKSRGRGGGGEGNRRGLIMGAHSMKRPARWALRAKSSVEKRPAFANVSRSFVMPFSRQIALAVTILIAGASLRAEDFQGSTHPLPFDEPLINYSAAVPE